MPEIGDHDYRETTPRCPVCGRFAQLEEEADTVLVYTCCRGDFERVVPKPNRVTPEFRRKYL